MSSQIHLRATDRYRRRYRSDDRPLPDELASRLRASYTRFRWINAYRSRDPIGRSLFANGQDYSIDIDTKQEFKGIAAHVGYWDDEEVATKVCQALQQPVSPGYVTGQAPARLSLWDGPRLARKCSRALARSLPAGIH